MKLISSGMPLWATTAIPNEPAWPPSPEPSSYAQIGVGGKLGCSCRAIGRCVNAYWFIPLGVATTIPAPGNGNGWIYLVSKLCDGLSANAWRTVHGRVSPALAAAPHLRKDRLVIMPPLWWTMLRWLRIACETLVAFCPTAQTSAFAGRILHAERRLPEFRFRVIL